MIQGCRPCGGECKPASAIWCVNACQVFVPVHPIDAHFQFAAVHFMFPGGIDVCMRRLIGFVSIANLLLHSSPRRMLYRCGWSGK